MTTGTGVALVMPDVYKDLELAYQGLNGFGGHVAEIYAYRLVLRHRDRPSGSASDFSERDAHQAAHNLRTLCASLRYVHPDAVFSLDQREPRLFEEIDLDAPKTIRTDGTDYWVGQIEPFTHRIHIRVEPRHVDDPKIAIYINWKNETDAVRAYRIILNGRSTKLEWDGGKDALGGRYWQRIADDTGPYREIIAIALRALADGKSERSYSNGVLELRVPGTFEAEI